MIAQHQLAGGSTIGRDHRLVPKNNQDSWSIWRFDDMMIGIVADGCGSGAHSDVGAKLGVQMLGECLRKDYRPHRPIRWQRVQQHMLAQLDGLARAMGDDYRKIVETYLLFTLLGVVIDNDRATFFALGDGTIIINGQTLSIGPFQGNMPPYLGYGLLLDELTVDATTIKLEPLWEMPIDQLDSFLIATDGIDDVIRNSQNVLPGLNVPVGPIEQFWQSDRYFGSNSELVSRQLKLIGRDWPLSQPHPGLLGDDTTMIVGRRTPITEMEET
jgi:serine/threonine protein phosphatase PrpC